jgi:serine phosphatase RsbU (regulator of sigma subunit)
MLLGDVSGKGPAAAMLMSLAVAHLDATLAHSVELPRAISLLGDRIVRDFNGQRFITAVAARFHDDGKAILIDAGHGIMLRVSATGEVSTLTVEGGVGIGMMGEADYDSTTLEFVPGDRLVLFTDGITEQRDPAGRMLEIEGAAQALAGSLTPEEDLRRLLSALRSHAAKPTFADDVTIASIVYDPAGAA